MMTLMSLHTIIQIVLIHQIRIRYFHKHHKLYSSSLMYLKYFTCHRSEEPPQIINSMLDTPTGLRGMLKITVPIIINYFLKTKIILKNNCKSPSIIIHTQLIQIKMYSILKRLSHKPTILNYHSYLKLNCLREKDFNTSFFKNKFYN